MSPKRCVSLPSLALALSLVLSVTVSCRKADRGYMTDDDAVDDDTSAPDQALDPNGDPDEDGVTTRDEWDAGTDPLDPSSAPAWHPEWSGHPRLLFDLDRWQQIKAAILSEDPRYVPYYNRLKADGIRPFEEHTTPEFQPAVNERNSRTVLGAAVTYAVEDDHAALAHSLDVIGQMRADIWPLSLDDLDQSTIHTSRALINLCEAYDLLEGIGALDDEDRTLVRDYVRGLAANWYDFHVGFGRIILLLTQNNHNIKSASGMAFVGMTLNDLPEAATYVNYGLLDAWYFLTEYQSPPGGGQAEGPSYLAYSALNYLPAFWAYHRFADGRTFPYKTNCANRWGPCSEEIVDFADPATRPELSQVHRWWHRIAMPSGYGPNIEDANLNCFFNGTAAAMTLDPVLAWRDGALPRCKGHASGTEMLRLAIAHLIPGPQQPELVEADFMPEAGQAVFRSSWSEDAVYGLVIGEHGPARLHGGGHEQPDATSLIVAAYGEYLLIDSGYISWSERMRVAKAKNHNLILIDGRGPPRGIAGLGVDVDAYLTHTFSRTALAGVRVETGWQKCDITRDVLFSQNSRFYVADRLLCPGTEAHDFTLLWHANAGGTAGGSFALEADGFSAVRDLAGVRVHVGCAGNEPALSHEVDEHALNHQPATHEVFHADVSSNDAAFVSAILPAPAEDAYPQARVVRSDPDAAAVIVEDEDFIEWFGSTRGDGPMSFEPDGVVRSIETDAQAAFLRLSKDGSAVVDFHLVEGSYLKYDGAPVR